MDFCPQLSIRLICKTRKFVQIWEIGVLFHHGINYQNNTKFGDLCSGPHITSLRDDRSNTINVQIEIKHSLNSPCWEQVNCFKFNVKIFVFDGLLFGWIYRCLHRRGRRSRKFVLTRDCSSTI